MMSQAPIQSNPQINNVVRLPLTVGAATIAVRKLRGLTIAEKGLLYTIAAHMPDCRPGIGLLVEETGASRPQVFKLLKALEAKGYVRRVRRGGRYGTNSYELVFQPAEGSPGDTQGSLLETSQGSLLETQGGKDLRRQTKRADGGPERVPGKGRVGEDSPTPIDAPSGTAGAVPRVEEGGDGGPTTPVEAPPESGDRYELPDVSTPEPAVVDREVDALYRRKDRGETLVTEPRHLAAAFDACHRRVYGFSSPEIRGPKLWKCAVAAATRTTNDYFAGDIAEAARYVEWAWRREVAAWERGKRRERPIGWRLVFGEMVGDYLRAIADRSRRAA